MPVLRRQRPLRASHIMGSGARSRLHGALSQIKNSPQIRSFAMLPPIAFRIFQSTKLYNSACSRRCCFLSTARLTTRRRDTFGFDTAAASNSFSSHRHNQVNPRRISHRCEGRRHSCLKPDRQAVQLHGAAREECVASDEERIRALARGSR
jgi:hypothetical protein